MTVDVSFRIPARIQAGLDTGDLIRSGGVVRNRVGRIVTFLEEASRFTPDEGAVASAAWMVKKPVVIGGLALAAAAATAAVAIARRQNRALAECVTNYNDSLHDYLEAVRDQSLTAAIVDRLIAALGLVQAHSESGIVTIDLSAEHLETLVQVVISTTRQRAQANSIDLDESPPSPAASTRAPVVNLRHYLEIQRRTFNDAA
ncbi:hypothetical protein [Amycolatopsis regifaucium]|uniref:Uncharacterized protein n=1 Tax=Amycolatopsis regifaucium TaxID=546365 RepID=A0A154M5F3_9PSEU|nr:hypothetical protein [Amycolatopsis regifaucium]KZB79640.1 hypothetical protein AVL48_14590 [Amycolatopsis regifaucium]OKA10043.1 hypothetical protein ATP06_0206825 [Amycolatopsis regifaucium]SFI63741.1 hypothetical protein SAMN04489731_11223 [Amycolatopsis regifaucium]